MYCLNLFVFLNVFRYCQIAIQPFLFNLYLTGGYLLYVYWSDNLVPGSPYKLTVTTRGASNKVKVSGAGLKGGFVGQELRVVVDISEAGNGTYKT